MRNGLIKLVLTVGVVSLPLLIYWGCQKPETFYGSEKSIVVIADSTDWVTIESAVTDAFEKVYYTPQPEKVFTVVKIRPEDMDDYLKYRNICIIGTLQTGGIVGETLNSVLAKKDRQRVQDDSSYVFRKIDPWARGQLLLVVVAKDIETLLSRLKEHRDVLFALYDQHATDLARKNLLQNEESKKLADSLAAEFGWTLDIHLDYFLAIKSVEDRFVWLRRLRPNRWLFVHWIETDNPSLLSKDWIIKTRNQLSQTYYQGDIVVDKFTQVQEVDFIGKYALRVDGHWDNEKLNVGGAFRSYGFYDEKTERLYLIDLAVHAPGERKLPYIRQLDAMAYTFRLVAPSTIHKE